MKGITERSFSRSSLIRSGIYAQGLLAGDVARGFLLSDAGSAVPAAVLDDGDKYFEQRPTPWFYEWMKWGESGDARIAELTGSTLKKAGQIDGRVLWAGDVVAQLHDNSGNAGYARATVENTAAAGDRLQIADGTHTRLYEGEDTLGIFDFLATQAYGDQIRVADGVLTYTLTLTHNTDIALGRVEMGSTAAQTAANVYYALNEAIRAGLLSSDIVVYQDSAANITLSRYSVAGVLTLTAPTNAGPTINAATLQSLAATAGNVRFAIRTATVGTTEDLIRAIIYDQGLGNLDSDITIYQENDNLGAGTTVLRLRRETGVITLTTPVNAGPTFSGVVSVTAARPARVKLRIEGFDTCGTPHEEEVLLECDGDGTAGADVFYRSQYAYQWCHAQILEKENIATADYLNIGNEFRHHSLRCTLLDAGTALDTYVINDGVNPAVTFTFKAVAPGALDVLIGASAGATATNLKAKVDAQIGVSLAATMLTTLDDGGGNAGNNSLLIWDTQATNRPGYKHTETGTTCWLEDGPGKTGFSLLSGNRQPMSEANIKIGLFWRVRDIRDITCVKFDRQHVGDGAAIIEANNNVRGFYPLNLVRGNGTVAPYIDRRDNSLVVNNYTELTRSAVYNPSGAVHELKTYPEGGMHFLMFQFDPLEPQDLPQGQVNANIADPRPSNEILST